MRTPLWQVSAVLSIIGAHVFFAWALFDPSLWRLAIGGFGFFLLFLFALYQIPEFQLEEVQEALTNESDSI